MPNGNGEIVVPDHEGDVGKQEIIHRNKEVEVRVAYMWMKFLALWLGAFALAISPLIVVLVSNVSAQTENVEASTYILRVPNEYVIHASLEWNDMGGAILTYPEWRLPEGYTVPNTWVQVEVGNVTGRPVGVFRTDEEGVTTITIPSTAFPSVPTGGTFWKVVITYQISNGITWRSTLIKPQALLAP